jgi:hypothetical protein
MNSKTAKKVRKICLLLVGNKEVRYERHYTGALRHARATWKWHINQAKAALR